MNKNPTVSVIIPTYNRAHLVGRAIQSVLDQTYQDFESNFDKYSFIYKKLRKNYQKCVNRTLKRLSK